MKPDFYKRLYLPKHLLFILLMVAFAISLVFAFVPNTDHVTLMNEHSQPWNEDWLLDGQTVTLPHYMRLEAGQTVTISKTIDNPFENSGMSVSILTSMQSLSVLVDGEDLYNYSQKDNVYMELHPPPAWHVIRLTPEMIGKTISIRYSSPLSSYGGVLNEIEVGSKFATVTSFLSTRFLSLILCFIILIFGIICMAISLLFRRAMSEFNRLLYFGVFSCLLAIWSACETKALQIFTENVQLLSALTYLCIMVAPVPLLLFFRERFQGKIRLMYSGLIIVFSAFFLVVVLLQFAGHAYFSTYFFLFLSMVGVCCIAIVVSLFIDYFEKKTVECKLYILAMICLMVFGLADFLKFTFGRIFLTSSGDSTMYTRIGVLLFTFIMGYLTARTMIGYYKASVLANTYKTLAHTDNLTKLYNRSYMQDICAKIFNNSIRNNHSFSLIIADIDNFKEYNDFYGHLKGDRSLAAVAEVLKASAHRPLDTAIRYGGEEFLILLPDSGLAGAEHVARQALRGVSALKIPHKHSDTSRFLSASMGIYSAVPKHGDTLESFILMADQALYKAKGDGKNQYVVYNPVSCTPIEADRPSEAK